MYQNLVQRFYYLIPNITNDINNMWLTSNSSYFTSNPHWNLFLKIGFDKQVLASFSIAPR